MTISDFHRLRGWPKPAHPLLSLVDIGSVDYTADQPLTGVVINFYSICIKRGSGFTFRYGQQGYDFDSGILFFMGPNQVFSLSAYGDDLPKQSGWLLLIHPDFLWNTHLSTKISQYDFFDYSVNEALWLSESEEATIHTIIATINQEYHQPIDGFSKQIIVSHLETLLSYADRFYHRQFIAREKVNHQILARLEALLTDYFSYDELLAKGLPTVHYVADKLAVSPRYLSGLLRSLTGQNTQQHIHQKLIDKAKEKLSTTTLSVREIAYGLGFAHSQSFSKLFKAKTNCSHSSFRQSFTT